MRTDSIRNLFLLVTVVSIGILAVACGGGDDEPTATATSRPADPTPTATSAPEPTTPSGVEGDAARGEELFVSQTCSACHSTGDAQIVGPGLKGIKDRAAELGGDAYLTESITNPGAVVVEGFAPIMSSFAHLDDQTVADLVAYLNTLE